MGASFKGNQGTSGCSSTYMLGSGVQCLHTQNISDKAKTQLGVRYSPISFFSSSTGIGVGIEAINLNEYTLSAFCPSQRNTFSLDQKPFSLDQKV